ncbi:MAG: PaREP1 family protein [Dehalococcoidia bacterium]|nr:PaREP1 family protein [Dehalococcoidia bacterium]
MTTRTQYHAATALDFMAKTRSYLDEGDLLQASEKGWGAAAQAVKAVAEARGWQHNGHYELFAAVNRLTDETGDQDIRRAFAAANALHTNFYEGWLPRETVAAHLSDIEELVGKLRALSD